MFLSTPSFDKVNKLCLDISSEDADFQDLGDIAIAERSLTVELDDEPLIGKPVKW